MFSVISQFLEGLFRKCEEHAGICTCLAGIFLFGVGLISTESIIFSAGMACIGFAIIGFLQLSYEHTSMESRRMNEVPDDVKSLVHISKHKSSWQIEELEEFSYCSVKWKSMGFDQLRVPITIAGPLCPACGSKMAYRACHRYIVLPVYILYCHCGDNNKRIVRLPKPLSMVREEVLNMKNVPK